VFGLLCLIISFQLLTKSQKQKTYLFSTNLACLIDKTLLSFGKKFSNNFPFIFTLILFLTSCIVLTMQEESKTNTIPIIIGIGTSVLVSIGIYHLLKKKSPMNDSYYFLEIDNSNGITDPIKVVNKNLEFKFWFFEYEYIVISEGTLTSIYIHTYQTRFILGWLTKFLIDNLSSYNCRTEIEGLHKLIDNCSVPTIREIVQGEEDQELVIFSCPELKQKFINEAEPYIRNIVTCQPS